MKYLYLTFILLALYIYFSFNQNKTINKEDKNITLSSLEVEKSITVEHQEKRIEDSIAVEHKEEGMEDVGENDEDGDGILFPIS
jgi:Ca2+/Na+ antiporter